MKFCKFLFCCNGIMNSDYGFSVKITIYKSVFLGTANMYSHNTVVNSEKLMNRALCTTLRHHKLHCVY